MLRGNLSTRPFYNERLVSFVIALVGIVVLALTAFNLSQLLSLSSQRSELRAKIARDRNEAARISSDAATLDRTVNRGMLQVLAGSTREANALIDERTFSWTVFFGLIEKTLPLDVRLVAVSPRSEKGERRIEMLIVAQGSDDLDTFIDALLDTGAFYDVVPKSKQSNDDGSVGVAIEAGYLAPGAARTASSATGGKGQP